MHADTITALWNQFAAPLRSFVAKRAPREADADDILQEVFVRFHGLTQLEAASLAGISLSGMKSRVQRGREHLKGVITVGCHIETDVRGRVIECDPRSPRGCGDWLRPSWSSNDSMNMKNTTDSNRTETKPTETSSRTDQDASGCCGGAAPKDSNACCALDAQTKASGGTGCGCNPAGSAMTKKGCC